MRRSDLPVPTVPTAFPLQWERLARWWDGSCGVVPTVPTWNRPSYARACVCVFVGGNSGNNGNRVSIELFSNGLRVPTCVPTRIEKWEHAIDPAPVGQPRGNPGATSEGLSHPAPLGIGRNVAATRRCCASLRSAGVMRSPADAGGCRSVHPEGLAVHADRFHGPINRQTAQTSIIEALGIPGVGRGSSPRFSYDRGASSTNIFVGVVVQSACASDGYVGSVSNKTTGDA